MQGTLMLGGTRELFAAAPHTCCGRHALPQRRAHFPVCSIPTTVQAAAAVAFREEVIEQQAQSSSVSSAVNGADSVSHASRAVSDNPQSAPGSASSSSPWRQRTRLAIADAQQMQAGLTGAEAQAGQHAASQPRQQQGSQPPTRRRHPIARASDAAPGHRHAVSSQHLQREQHPKVQQQPPHQQQPQRRRRPSPQDLQRSRRSAPLQTAVRSNKQHDWQVTRDWLLMEMGDTNLNDSVFEDIADAADLPDSCRPQVAFYHELGMSKAEIARMARSRTQLFYLALPTIESKLKFLREEAGITSAEDMRKLLLKFPRIVEYKTERTLRPRLDFLKRYHIEGADISKVVMRAPAMLELNVAETLEPRVEFLRTAACVPEDSLAKVLVRCPSLLTCTEGQMAARVDFLRRCGVDDAQMAKAVVAFPQMLYLKVDAMEEKVRYLYSIGVGAEQMGKVIARLPQLLSLNVANNMAPKFEYLRSELGGTVETIAGFPAYFSLSMPQRIVPRHRFLQEVHTQRHWPFPMTYLKLTDETFAKNVAGRSLDEFMAFRQHLTGGIAPTNGQPAAGGR